MPNTYKEGRVRFTFPDDWRVLRPETAAYYKRHFQVFCGGTKEMDFLLWDPGEKTMWMLEVKDYTTNARTKSGDLMDEVALKVRDSLGLLCAAASNDTTHPALAGNFARNVLPLFNIRVGLHLEQPTSPSKLFPGVKLAADASQLLRTKVKCIDRHAKVVSTSDSVGVSWTSTWEP